MLDQFLETCVQNKLKIISALYPHHTVSHKMLCSICGLSFQSVSSLLDEISSDIESLGKIEKSSSGLSLLLFEEVNFFQLFRAVSKNSLTLHCLKFLLLNDNNNAFSDFTDEAYLTKSSSYRIRQKCREYLRAIGLDIHGNRVVGPEYRIRFLIALLHYKYGIDCYDMDQKSLYSIRKFILSTNEMIDAGYLEQSAIEYGYFEYLVMLSWKRISYPLSQIHSEQLTTLKKVFIYDKMKKTLKATIESDLNLCFSENDYEYLYIVYCSTNSCIFADKWTDSDIKFIHRIIFSNTAFSDLLNRLQKIFPKNMTDSHALRATLVYFYKKCFLELQCIIPDKNFFIPANRSSFTDIIFQHLSPILRDWKTANGIAYKMEQNHILYLSLQLEFILRQFIEPIPVFVLSDLNAELEVMQLYLMRAFSAKRITVYPILLNAQKKDILFSQKNSVIIVPRKFIHLCTSLNISARNTIVPVSVEMTDAEVNAIQKAIVHHENEQFFNFIKQNPSE